MVLFNFELELNFQKMAEELTDEQAINKAVDMLKEKGIFDQIRKNCLEDINTKVNSKRSQKN